MILLFLSSGLFLGWSLGANDAANVFGTAVATRMVRFRTAAIVCGMFVVLGAVVSGTGASDTLGELGAVNAIGGSFMVALAAALAVMWMTKAGLPVSVSQAIIGGILGWNVFTGSRTDMTSLARIVSTWVVCPALSAAFAAGFYVLARLWISRARIHLLELDALTRALLVVAGGFGAYSLGANNIANVMGVFVPAFPARSFHVFGMIHLTHAQILFFVGGLAIATGVVSYSRRVMMTIGKGLFKLSPVTALIVVVAESLVLFVFASERLESFLIAHGLPSVPLVPVSSSQAVIGAVIGIALVKGGRNMRFGMLRRIAGGWVATPAIAAVVAFLGLFFLQNVFGVSVARPVPFELTPAALEHLEREGVPVDGIRRLEGIRFENAHEFKVALDACGELSPDVLDCVFESAEIDCFEVDPARIEGLDPAILTEAQIEAIRALEWHSYQHKWEFCEALARASKAWAFLPETRANHLANKRLATRLHYVYDTFRLSDCREEPGGRR